MVNADPLDKRDKQKVVEIVFALEQRRVTLTVLALPESRSVKILLAQTHCPERSGNVAARNQ
tara:strand:- start:781 stop:966 length:186 start_codon:yes stop_codon:yes gene_type:complete